MERKLLKTVESISFGGGMRLGDPWLAIFLDRYTISIYFFLLPNIHGWEQQVIGEKYLQTPTH